VRRDSGFSDGLKIDRRRINIMLSPQDKRELLEMAHSSRMREDFRIMAGNRHNPFLVNGVVDLNKFVDFLNDYNESINHVRRPFRKIIAKDMRL